MNPLSNRSIVEAVFSALARGDRQPFADATADDFSWTTAGHGQGGGRGWRGRILDDLDVEHEGIPGLGT